MAMATENHCIEQIGMKAGDIWHALHDHGPMSLAKLVERIGGNRDIVMQGVGWLACERKLEITETKRGRIVALKQ